MGSLPTPSSTMKMFLVLALAAAAGAEYISTYGAYPYTTYGAYPYTMSYGVYGGVYSSPIISSLYNRHIIAKREAEDCPALVCYTHPGATVYAPYISTYGTHPYTTYGAYPYTGSYGVYTYAYSSEKYYRKRQKIK